MIKRVTLIIITASILLVGSLVVSILLILSKDKPELVYNNGQFGLVVDKKVSNAVIDGENLELYQSVSNPLTLSYQSMNMDMGYDNEIVVNGNSFSLESSSNEQNTFVQNSMILLGLNVIDGVLTVTFKTGQNAYGSYDTFELRNVILQVGDETYWSTEYPQDVYNNTGIDFGYGLETNYRYGYLPERTFTFTINEELLDINGTLLTSDEAVIDAVIDDKTYSFDNNMSAVITTNITNQAIIDTSFTLDVQVEGHTDFVWQAYLDGYAIRSDFEFSSDAWSSGTHELLVVAANNFGFVKDYQVTFTLADVGEATSQLAYTAYEPGVDATLDDRLPADFGNEVILTDYETPFSSSGVLYLEVDVTDDTTIHWQGESLLGRTLVMQAYNFEKEQFETVSTALSGGQTLGFDYDTYGSDYVDNQKVYVRVASTNVSDADISHQLFHITDTQYMTRYISNPGFYSQDAIDAYTAMIDYMVDQYENNHLAYVMTTGDYVQTMTDQENEWQAVNTYFLNPLFASDIPFGVLAGNHDVGGTSDNPNSTAGGNTLDADLIYDHYETHLGDSKFLGSSWFAGSYLNNRSHFDLVTIEEQNFLFLYLGWGSSFIGRHVSSLDIDYAKTVLEAYPNHTVVLLTHEYLGNTGLLGLTGSYVQNQLVSTYENIKFVISGHINGTVRRVDYFDDNHDGVKDRSVLQILTNFQEEESLFGASWIRQIGLDFTHNKMYWDIYSPYYNDYDIYVTYHPDIVVANRAFTYDFDLSDIGYVMKTEWVG